jgi:hypothetical protein
MQGASWEISIYKWLIYGFLKISADSKTENLFVKVA